jgi:hypothetical protein
LDSANEAASKVFNLRFYEDSTPSLFSALCLQSGDAADFWFYDLNLFGANKALYVSSPFFPINRLEAPDLVRHLMRFEFAQTALCAEAGPDVGHHNRKISSAILDYQFSGNKFVETCSTQVFQDYYSHLLEFFDLDSRDMLQNFRHGGVLEYAAVLKTANEFALWSHRYLIKLERMNSQL